VLSLLHPFRLANATKIRVGRPNDGGYVMVDDFAGIRTALSLGINDDVSWDLGMATRQIRVRQFDHTVDGPPEPHPAFEFHKRRITPTDDGNGVSIATLLRQCRSEGDQAILKIDIEGDEELVVPAIAPHHLDRIGVIYYETDAPAPLHAERFEHRYGCQTNRLRLRRSPADHLQRT